MEIKYFSISELFHDPISGKEYVSVLKKKAGINYISRQDGNNGFECFINIQDTEPMKEHCITVGAETQACFYQPFPFYHGRGVISLYPKIKINKYIGIYLSSQLSQLKKKYSYGMALYKTRLRKESIPLPTSDGINPDWDYIENTVKKIYEKQKKKAVKIKPIEQFKPEIRYFSINELFEYPISGKDLSNPNDKYIKGKTPFITGTTINKGVERMCDQNPNINTPFLSVVRVGESGTAFYHEKDSYMNGNVRGLKLKFPINKYIGIYLSSQISKLTPKYSYGMTLSTTRLQKEYIPLPCTLSGEIDWDYMENIVKSVMG